MMKTLFRAAAVFVAVGLLAPGIVCAQQVWYVDAGAAGAGDGRAWADAFPSLQDALAAARAGDEVWVAEGVYTPVVPADTANVTGAERAVSFALKNGVALYGGFAGTEAQRAERDVAAYPTVLSGDLRGDDNGVLDVDEPTRADNSYHVVFAGIGVDSTAVLDGFTVTAGNASTLPPQIDDKGGGLYVLGGDAGGGQLNFPSPTLRHVVFTANTARFGGGVGCSFARPTLEHVVFEANVAAGDGGGMESFISGPTLRHVVFRDNASAGLGGGMNNNRGASIVADVTFAGNTAGRGGGLASILDRSAFSNALFLGNEAVEAGGGVYNDAFQCDDCLVSFVNAVFSGNRTTDADTRGGGGMYNFRAGPLLVNVTFAGNTTAHDGGAIHNVNSSPTLANVILWGNRADGSGPQIHNMGSLSAPTAAFSLLEGGLPEATVDAGGNRDADPLFVDADGADDRPGTDDDDLRLQAGSPAIDAGDNGLLPADYLDFDRDGDKGEPLSADLAGNVRVFDGGSGLPVVDMGGYEFGAPPAVAVAVAGPSDAPPALPALLTTYPNPFRAQATLQYELPAPGRVVLKVYDVLGREVAMLVDEVQPAGRHEVVFEAGHLASGLYLTHLDADGRVVTRKMLRVK